jgi:hypothetical protein
VIQIYKVGINEEMLPHWSAEGSESIAFHTAQGGFYRVVFESDIQKMFAGAFSFCFLKIEALSSRANFFHRQSMGSPKWQHLDNSFGTGTTKDPPELR